MKNSFPNWISLNIKDSYRLSYSDSTNDDEQDSSRATSTSSLAPYLPEMTKEEADDILKDSPKKVCQINSKLMNKTLLYQRHG